MKDAKQWKVEVEQEDVVVMGSDGLVDNLVSTVWWPRYHFISSSFC